MNLLSKIIETNPFLSALNLHWTNKFSVPTFSREFELIFNTNAYLFDIANFLFVLLIIGLSFYFKLINIRVASLLALSALTPFFFNNVIFPWNFMPDQIQYYKTVNTFRSFDIDLIKYFLIKQQNLSIKASGFMYAFLPIPYVATISSLAFFNKAAYSALVIYLNSRKILSGSFLFLFIFFPSVILYTSVSLRDTLVYCFVTLFFLFLCEKKWLGFLIFGILLFLSKQPTALICFAIAYLYILFFIIYKKNIYLFCILLFSTVYVLINYENDFLIYVNKIRYGMYLTDGYKLEEIPEYANFLSFIVEIFFGGFYAIFRPAPWEAHNLFQHVQSFENLFFLLVLSIVFFKSFKKNNYRAIFWTLAIFFGVSVMSAFLSNVGTFSRFKFPITLPILLIMYFDCVVKKKKL